MLRRQKVESRQSDHTNGKIDKISSVALVVVEKSHMKLYFVQNQRKKETVTDWTQIQLNGRGGLNYFK